MHSSYWISNRLLLTDPFFKQSMLHGSRCDGRRRWNTLPVPVFCCTLFFYTFKCSSRAVQTIQLEIYWSPMRSLLMHASEANSSPKIESDEWKKKKKGKAAWSGGERDIREKVRKKSVDGILIIGQVLYHRWNIRRRLCPFIKPINTLLMLLLDRL